MYRRVVTIELRLLILKKALDGARRWWFEEDDVETVIVRDHGGFVYVHDTGTRIFSNAPLITYEVLKGTWAEYEETDDQDTVHRLQWTMKDAPSGEWVVTVEDHQGKVCVLEKHLAAVLQRWPKVFKTGV
ncbi:hypothetical protein HDV00_001816 [Rhizophlyctis rosea]|nr:hypothetical protein HDV00_001816 [Rhizophlyctis rosea]